MKPRIVKTTKILAIALGTAAAGCVSHPAGPIATAETALPAPIAPVAEQAAATPPTAPTEVPAAAPPEARPASRAAAPEQRPTSDDPKLLALRNELANRPRGKPLADAARFRPLCDADGYPLVGNLARKTPTYQASAFCKDLREAGVR